MNLKERYIRALRRRERENTGWSTYCILWFSARLDTLFR